MATYLSLSLLPQSTTSVFNFSPSSSSSSSIRCLTPTKINTVKDPEALTLHSLIRLRQNLRNTHHRKSLVLRSSVDDVSVINPPPPRPPPRPPANPELIASLKLKLLSVVSGLNRGLAANEDDLRKAEAAAKDIETVGGPVDLSVDLDKLQGRWKLIYSSAFSGKTLGGSRPGPPTRRLLPITLGQVFQRIDIISKDFDNIAEVELGTPWPLPPIEVTATLAHKFEVIEPAAIKITFEQTTVKTSGNLSQLPPLELPRLPDGLRPQSDTRRGEFEVTYIDDDTRITRGDRGELRVFVIS